MTIWRPDPSTLKRPVYASLAEQIARAIADGSLPDGTQLPVQRKLADELGIAVQTVSRAYEDLARRGLIAGETGRGTFVRSLRREPEPPYLPERLNELIDLSILKPVCEPIHLERMKQALGRLAQDVPASALLSFRPNVVFPRHRAAGAEWLRGCGLEISPLNVTVTNGATAAQTIALMSTAPPGSTIATEAIGHHTLTPLATYLGLNLVGIPVDEDGMVPDALERACAEHDLRAAFVQPNVINPCAILMSEARRAEIVAVARRRDIALVENDVLGPFVERRPPPLARLAPERTLYVTSFTKIVMPGLRIGYLAVPDRYVAAAANRHLVTMWMATPLMAEIASDWVTDGTALDLVRWQRRTIHARHRVVSEALSGIAYRSHPESLHVWVPLPETHSEAAFVAHARAQGVAIAPGQSFRIGEAPIPPSVRISLGSTDAAQLRTGLAQVAHLIHAAPEPALLAI
ncbi:MocR-like ectoine utilization transcription factor EhuR [Salinarimonas ramus]|uniref:GntR family transcriptional regulator n=1 Tax=Salinarimonas ramus TaxID=690164 RepID=A0A917V292_9HYPH|nr:PLP-dependent aminotransferase family protein [Salinarimonas ramus]GGK21922.1 GntR family transcriptional regulator [Salinarimonas ramus]